MTEFNDPLVETYKAMKEKERILKEEKVRKKFESYSLDRQDEIIDRIHRGRFKRMAIEAKKEMEDLNINPHRYYKL